MHLSQYQNLTNTYVNTKINARITKLAKKKENTEEYTLGKKATLITTTEIGMQLSAVKAIRKRQLNCIKGLENSNVIAFRATPQHNKRVSSARLKTLRKTATTYSPTCPRCEHGEQNAERYCASERID